MLPRANARHYLLGSADGVDSRAKVGTGLPGPGVGRRGGLGQRFGVLPIRHHSTRSSQSAPDKVSRAQLLTLPRHTRLI